MVNTPIPHSLKSEAKKAATILSEFSMPSAKVGPDKIIPAGLIENAQGLAILTVIKVGFLVSVRGGSGIVIARLEDGSWSAPSALGIAGLGGGFEIGGEVTDFVIILNKRSAVEAFSKGGNLTLGGNFTVAAGPHGRNVEGDVAIRGQAAIYTYSRTKGLFAGISIEGSGLIERKDANKKFYGGDIRAYNILSGEVDRPESCFALYEVLAKHSVMFDKMVQAQAKKAARKGAEAACEKYQPGLLARAKSLRSGKSKSKSQSQDYDEGDSDDDDEPPSVGGGSLGGTMFDDWAAAPAASSSGGGHSSSGGRGDGGGGMKRSKSTYSRTTKTTTTTRVSKRGSGSLETLTAVHREQAYSAKGATAVTSAWDAIPAADSPPLATSYTTTSRTTSKPVTCRAVWAFDARMPCDLTFEPGEELEILTQTDTQDDWWEGRCRGKVGIFPANYIEVL